MANEPSPRARKGGTVANKNADPEKKSMEVALRLIRTLELIPKEPPRRTKGFAISAEEIAFRLRGPWRGQSFSDVGMRTVQRYLKLLKSIFGANLVSERCDFHYESLKLDKRDVWYWSKSAAPFNM